MRALQYTFSYPLSPLTKAVNQPFNNTPFTTNVGHIQCLPFPLPQFCVPERRKKVLNLFCASDPQVLSSVFSLDVNLLFCILFVHMNKTRCVASSFVKSVSFMDSIYLFQFTHSKGIPSFSFIVSFFEETNSRFFFYLQKRVIESHWQMIFLYLYLLLFLGCSFINSRPLYPPPVFFPPC